MAHAMTRIKAFFTAIKDKLLRLISDIQKSTKLQIIEYKSGKIIQRRRTRTRTVFATILYLLSALALTPSIAHILLDSLVHIPAMVVSASLFKLQNLL